MLLLPIVLKHTSFSWLLFIFLVFCDTLNTVYTYIPWNICKSYKSFTLWSLNCASFPGLAPPLAGTSLLSCSWVWVGLAYHSRSPPVLRICLQALYLMAWLCFCLEELRFVVKENQLSDQAVRNFTGREGDWIDLGFGYFEVALSKQEWVVAILENWTRCRQSVLFCFFFFPKAWFARILMSWEVNNTGYYIQAGWRLHYQGLEAQHKACSYGRGVMGRWQSASGGW